MDELEQLPSVSLGLLTGNAERGAQYKLKYFNLDPYFPIGAFGDHSLHRWELVDIAMKQAEAHWARSWPKSEVWLIGDTPQDIEAAKKSGVRVAAVATGPYSLEDLGSLRPDLLFPDLSLPEAAALLAGTVN